MIQQITTAARTVSAAVGDAPIGLVLGSGLGGFVHQLTDARSIAYGDIPGFPRSTVEGHAGRLYGGVIGGVRLLVMSGRFHYYEGYSAQEVTLPIRVLRALGVQTLILTNAAGAIRSSYRPGELMLLSDFLNCSGVNPLRGENDPQLGPRFPDMTYALSPALRALVREQATALGIALHEGVYAQMQGPSYETPAEIRMLRLLGADAVGMSTVPEILVARHGGMDVLGLSCLTNMAAGILDEPLRHEDVVDVGQRAQRDFTRLLLGVLGALPPRTVTL